VAQLKWFTLRHGRTIQTKMSLLTAGRTTFCSFCHAELMAKKWLDSIEKQKRSNVCDKQTDGHT